MSEENIVSDTPKFLLDENVRVEVKQFLESTGYSVEYAPKGTTNGRVVSLANTKQCVLVTRDSDFLNSVLFPPNQFFGIIVLQIHPPEAEKLIKGMELLLSEVKEFKGKLFIVEEERYEIV